MDFPFPTCIDRIHCNQVLPADNLLGLTTDPLLSVSVAISLTLRM